MSDPVLRRSRPSASGKPSLRGGRQRLGGIPTEPEATQPDSPDVAASPAATAAPEVPAATPTRRARSAKMSMSLRHSYIGSIACFMKIA